MAKRRFILAHKRSPGDIVTMSALVRDIHLTHPGKYETDVQTTVMPVWDNNPYLTRLWNHDQHNPQLFQRNVETITCQYGKGITEQNSETIHFVPYWHRDFERQTGIKVKCHYPYGDLHLTEKEKSESPINGRYWLVMTGGKSDFTIKVWNTGFFQETANRLNNMGLGFVQSGAAFGGHWHPKVKGSNVVDLVGWGGFREWVRQVYHADGVICGVTGAMHIAAALHKPCVVIAGGREAWWWEAYVRENKGFLGCQDKIRVPHRFLHTIGQLSCCKHRGCWRNKVVQISGDKSVCKMPIMTEIMPMAACMEMITPDMVEHSVLSYYADGTITPPPDTQLAHDIAQLHGKNGNPMTEFTDKSYPPISNPLEYERGDGAKIKMSIEWPDEPPEWWGKKNKAADITPAVPVPTTKVPDKPHGKKVIVPQGAKIQVNPDAKVTVRETNHNTARPGQSTDFSDDTILDHEKIGGKVTVFILFYGDHHDLHKKCLTSLLATTDNSRIDLRVGSNALCKESIEMIEGYVDQGFITKHYYHEENKFKYPVMREMFFDPELPIETKWVLWFDDDSTCDVEPAWLNILGNHIVRHHHDKEAHMIGAKYTWNATEKVRNILSQRPWFTGRPWQKRNGQPSENGSWIIFATGGFWAITHELIVAADIPDLGTGLTHTGGDWQIGCQVYQAGYNVKQFNGKKQFVRTSSVKRRGVTMPTINELPATPTETPSPPKADQLRSPEKQARVKKVDSPDVIVPPLLVPDPKQPVTS